MKKLLTIILLYPGLFGLTQEQRTMSRHELGLNIAPLISPLINEDHGIRKFEMSYVTNFENKYSLRLKLSFLNLLQGSFSFSPDPFLMDTIEFNSEEMVRREYGQQKAGAIRLQAGLERNFNVGYANFYGGLGMVIGLNKDWANVYERRYRYEPEQDEYVSGLGGYRNSEHVRHLTIGASPYLGVKAPLGKHISIQFQTSIAYHYQFRYLYAVNKNARYKNFSGLFELFPPQGEVGIYWLF